MSEEQQISCALCHAYLFPEDDVVYCPECGAPHHRECYNSINKCALEQLHGTDRQYDKIKQKVQEEKETKEEQPQQPKFNQPYGNAVYLDLLGGVPKDYKLDEEVTADDAKNFVFSNTMRYIPKFTKLSKENKISWNFIAFLFPCSWFLSRKMYKNGIIAGILSIISSLFSLPLNKVLISLGIMDTVSYYEMAQRIAENLEQIGPAVILASFLGMCISLAIRIICALLGDYWYKNHTISTIKQLKKESSDLETDYRKKGGVNIFLFFIGYIAIQYIPIIISTFI